MNARTLWSAVCLCVAGVADGANPNSAITVLPATPVSVTTTLGQNPATRTVVFTLTNSGRGVVRWAAGVDADWVELSPCDGVLLPHRRTELRATIGDTSLFRSGLFTATLGVTNRSGNQPVQLRSIVLRVEVDAAVRLPAPELVEPTFTRGTSNSISWTRVPGANEYRVQASSSADFSSVFSSGWVSGTNYNFLNLMDGTTYYYRVQCRSNSTVWSQTLPGQFATNENWSVSTRTQPGDLVLMGNTNRIWVEDFESPGVSWTNTIFNDLNLGAPQSQWEKGPLGMETFAPETEPPLPINQRGDQEGRLFAVGAYHRFAYMTNVPENVSSDVTVDAFLSLGARRPIYSVSAGVVLRADPTTRTDFLGGDGFGAYIEADGSSDRRLNIYSISRGIHYVRVPPSSNRFSVEDPDENYHLRFAADGSGLTLSLWRIRAVDGIIQETPVVLGNGTNAQFVRDSSRSRGVVGLAGLAWSPSSSPTPSAFFDDVTIVGYDGPPHYAQAGTSTATVTPPPWFEKWGRLDFTASRPAPHTALTVDVLDARGGVLVENVPAGVDLGAIPSVARSASVRLRANFRTADPTQTPALSDWRVGYRLPEQDASESEWSAPAISTQDNLPPMLSITSPGTDHITVSNAAFTLEGTAFDAVSGLSRVRVLAFIGFTFRDFDAETSNAFANWTLQFNLLPGENSLRLIASDNTQPANVFVTRLTVVYRPPAPVGPGVPPEAPDADGSEGRDPRLSIHITGGVAILSWSPSITDGTVQTATTLSPPDWTDLAEVTLAPFTVPLTGHSRFFRLRLK